MSCSFRDPESEDTQKRAGGQIRVRQAPGGGRQTAGTGNNTAGTEARRQGRETTRRGREARRRRRRQGGGGRGRGRGKEAEAEAEAARQAAEATRRGQRQHGRRRRQHGRGRQHGRAGGRGDSGRGNPETGRTAAGQKDGRKQKRRGRHEKSAAPDWGAALVTNVPVDPHGAGSPAPLRTSVISPPRTRRPRAASRRSKHLRHCRPAAVRHLRRAAAPPGPAAGRRCPAKRPARRR